MRKKIKKQKPKRRAPRKPVIPLALDEKKVRAFVHDNLHDTKDFGLVEGSDKKILFKPGADKLARFFGVYPEYNLTREEKLADLHIDVVMFVKLVDATKQKVVWQSSLCSCNTLEDEYRFNWIRPICTLCNGRELTSGVCSLCHGKKYLRPDSSYAARSIDLQRGKWVKEMAGSVLMGYQWWERLEIPDATSQWNNVRQQAGKRAFVQAIRSYGCVSNIFSEDVADWYDAKRRTEAQVPEERKGGVTMEDESKSTTAG